MMVLRLISALRTVIKAIRLARIIELISMMTKATITSLFVYGEISPDVIK